MNILQTPLFCGLSQENLDQMRQSGCLRSAAFERGQQVLRIGQTVRELGLVLSGTVQIESVDPWGGNSLLSMLGPGHIFAESYALCGESLMVDVLCAEAADILFVNTGLALSRTGATWHTRLLANLLSLAARKNLTLSRRIFCTASRSARGRIVTYLSGEAARAGARSFQIPLNRQQLADYLGLDRSALSRELSRMRQEGLLSFHKNQFQLLALEP